MKILKPLLLVGTVLLGILSILGIALYIHKPLDEWMGLSSASFDSDAALHLSLPADTSHIFVYDTGFTDSAQWVAFSADKKTIKKFITNQLNISLKELSEWPPVVDLTQPHAVSVNQLPISAPPRAEWRNKDYWDVTTKSKGKVYSTNIKRILNVFYDTENSRLFFFRGDT